MEKQSLTAPPRVNLACPTGLPEFLEMPGAHRLIWVRCSPGVRAPAGWRLSKFLAFSRPRTCVAGMLAFYFASLVSGGLPPLHLVVGMVVSYHIAAIANLYNIYTDIVEDNENIPSRVFDLGRYGRDRLLRDTHLSAAAVFALSLLVNPYFAALTLLALIGCHQYSFPPLRMKARPRAGILYFANAVAYPYLSVALASDAKLHVFGKPSYSALALYLFFWFCAKGLVKNVPDYDGDKRVNVTTSATLSTTRFRAAMIAAVANVLVYAAIAIPVAAGSIRGEYLVALLWLPVACVQSGRLLYAPGQKSWNDMLRDDMFVSVGYLSTLILIEWISMMSIAILLLGLSIMVLSDRLGLDTRRVEDFELL
ncbi:UbiA family prenyltransferase [Mycobacterium sp.]|uniref:UbiA family prenyltransferase n=1 Tax=Mycobacterium sp. TaxID=1785 RepID=UPI003A83CA02